MGTVTINNYKSFDAAIKQFLIDTKQILKGCKYFYYPKLTHGKRKRLGNILESRKEKLRDKQQNINGTTKLGRSQN